ncbi:hypothetical protein V8B97DRAFT_1927729 [Scleroderma yunnanense]
MAKSAKKTDKPSASGKKVPAKKVEKTPKSHAVPASSKEILAKAAVLTGGAKSKKKKVDDSSSSEESSSSDEEPAPPKPAPSSKAQDKKAQKAPSPPSSSNEDMSSSEEEQSKSAQVKGAKTATKASSSESSDISSSEDEKPAPPVNAQKQKAAPAKAQKQKPPPADSESSSEEESPTSKPAPPKSSSEGSSDENDPSSAPAANAKKGKESSSESSDSESGSDSESEAPPVTNTKSKAAKPAAAPPKKDSLGIPNGKTKKSAKEKSTSDDSSSESESSDDSEEGEDEDVEMAEAPPATNKKRKADTEEAVAPTKKVKFADGIATPAATSDQETKGIFVGKLSWNVDNDWLAQEFSSCGEVESAHVQMDRNTGRSRGFGYVHFKSADAIEKALAMDGKEIDGRPIRVDKSTPPDKKAATEKRAQAFGDQQSPPSSVLFVGNLSFNASEDTLWETFGEHGDVKSVRIPTDRESGRPKGFAYVEFSDVEAAKKANETLQGLEIDGRSIRLDFSQPRDSASGGGGRGGPGGGRGRGRGGDRGWGDRGGRGGGRGGRGGFDRGRGFDRGGRGGGRGRGGGSRSGTIAAFEGHKITFD